MPHTLFPISDSEHRWLEPLNIKWTTRKHTAMTLEIASSAHSVVKSNSVKAKRKKMENQCHYHKQHNINLTWKFSFLSLSRPNIIPRGIQTYKKVCDKKRQKEQKCTYNFTIRTHSTKCQQRGQQWCYWQCQPHISLWHTTTALRIQHPSYTEFTCWPS